MLQFLKKHRVLLIIFLAGIVIRLLFAFFFNSTFDFFNILALGKSVADTCSLVAGFFALKRFGLQVQLYGKIYYELTALCLKVLDKVKLIQLRYLFDTKTYENPATYLQTLFHWGPPLYQLISIKMLQLLFDFVFVYFFYKTAALLKPKLASKALFFWAFTPFLMIVPYAVFQSDFFMLTCLMAGVYFWTKSLHADHNKGITRNKILTFTFLSLGAVVKQVPILLIPFAVFSFSGSLINFIFYSGISGIFYILLGQPWDRDAALMKQFFLMSKESTAILNFQLNSTSIFLFIYFFLLFLVFIKRKELFRNPRIPVFISILILSIIYMTEDSSFLFPQFNIWILPFLAILTLLDPGYGIFFLGPVFGFFKRVMIGVDLSGLLKPTLGYGFSNMLDYKYLASGVINSDLVGLFITSAMTVVYAYLFILLFSELFSLTRIRDFLTIKTRSLRLDLGKITILLVTLYSVLFVCDFVIKTRFVVMPSQAYQDIEKRIYLSTTPLEVKVSNQKGHTINALEIRSQRNEINDYDNTVFTFRKPDNSILFVQKVNDFAFPEVEDYFTVKLDQPITAKHFNIFIAKEKGANKISFRAAKLIGDTVGSSIYDTPSQDQYVHLTFMEKNVFEMNIRGQYEPDQMIRAIRYHISQKPVFFMVYFAIIGLLALAIICLAVFIKPT